MNVKELASTEDARLDEWNNFAATEALSRLDKPEDRVQTGFPALDKALGGGLLATGIHVIGAAPSMGDTTLVMQIAENASASGRKVLAFSLEASELTIVTKAISREMKRQNPRTAETATQIRAADRDMDPNGARWRAIERAKKDARSKGREPLHIWAGMQARRMDGRGRRRVALENRPVTREKAEISHIAGKDGTHKRRGAQTREPQNVAGGTETRRCTNPRPALK